MKRVLEKTEERREDLEASDSVKLIIEAYFDGRAIPHMEKMIEAYSAREGGLERALSTLYKAANYSREEYQKYLTELCRGRSQSPTQRLLEIISRYSSGDLLQDDPVLKQCRALSNLPLNVLQKQIGVFYKNKTNEFLREKNPELYEEIRREEAASEEMVANDVERKSPLAKKVEGDAEMGANSAEVAASAAASSPSRTVSSPVAAAAADPRKTTSPRAID